MKAMLRDLALWRQLKECDPTNDVTQSSDELTRELDLSGELQRLAHASPLQRVMHLGRLGPYLRHESSAVRNAALTALSGATGCEAYRYLVEGLQSENTRTASFQALARSAEHEPMRWWHALLHGDLDIRRRAIASLPGKFPKHWLLVLLPDRDLRSEIMESLTPFPHAPEALPMMLALVAAGEVSRLELLRWLASVPWEKESERYLNALPSKRKIFELPETASEVETFLTSPRLPRSALDQFFLLLCQEMERHTVPRSESASLSRNIMERIWECTHLRMTHDTRLHLAVSLGRISFHQWYWEPTTLALCAYSMPSLLIHPHLPLSLRKQAAQRYLQGVRGSHEAPTLTMLLCSDLCYTQEGCIDLTTLGGVLHLIDKEPYRRLLSQIREDDLLSALSKSPDQAAAFFKRMPDTPAEQKRHQKWLQLFLKEMPWSPERLAELALVLPSDQLKCLEHLIATPEAPQAVLQALFGLCQNEAQRIKESKLTRLATHMFSSLQVDIKASLTTLSATIDLPALDEDKESWRQWFDAQPTQAAIEDKGLFLATEILTLLGRHTPVENILDAIDTMTEETLVKWLALEACSILFPHELAMRIQSHLQTHPAPQIQAWCQLRTHTPTPARMQLSPPTDEESQLAPNAIEELATASESRRAELLTPCYQGRVIGLCNALEERAPTTTSAELSVALLLSYDPPEDVDKALRRHSEPKASFVKKIDALMGSRCELMTRLPWMGAVWMFRWERHRSVIEEQFLAQPEGLVHGLQWALHLQTPQLTLRSWQAIRAIMEQWRWRNPRRLAEHAPLQDPGLLRMLRGIILHNLLPESERVSPARASEELQAQAAGILALLHTAGIQLEALRALRLELLAHMPSFPQTLRSALSHWLDARPPRKSHTATLPQNTAPPELLQEVSQTKDLAQLAGHCLSQYQEVVEEASCQLLMLDGGVAQLIDIWRQMPKSTSARPLANALPLWPDDAGTREILRSLITAPHCTTEVQFFLALGLAECGEKTLHIAIEALCAPTKHQWARYEDWHQLVRIARRDLNADILTIATRLMPTAHESIRGQALHFVMSQPTPHSRQQLDALVQYLELPTHDPLSPLRLEVAERLHQHQRNEGLPLRCAVIYNPRRKERDKTEGEEDFFVGMSDVLIAECFRGALLLGTKHIDIRRMMQHLQRPGVSRTARQEALLMVLQTSPPGALQQLAIGQLAPTRTRQVHLQRLGKTFAWGIQKGRELTGKLFNIELIAGEDLGYTRLSTPKIYINPLPMLRREQHGEAIVRGLIIHELGHHIYHADKEGLATWKQAEQEQLQRLLNLVSDEQLERNLRARERSFGNDLKQLAAYAFQHAERDMHWKHLLAHLGAGAFRVLCGADLRPSRKQGQVVVQMGHLLFALEAQGKSFARFVRALRMGLGNRHNDPKVSDALRLFRKRFRRSNMPEMLEIARSLRDIFGDEVDLLDILDQQEGMGCNSEEAVIIGEGMTQEELQREIERHLQAPSKRKKGQPSRTINVASGEEFQTIKTILPVLHDRVAHKEYAQKTARWSRKMRGYLQQLGLGMVPQRKRLAGHRLDRGQLQNAVIRRDPRILVARKMQYKTDLFLGILIDCSGSMEIGDNIERARLFASMLAEAAAPLKGIDARFIGFTDTVLYDAGNATRCAVHGLEVGGGNNDAAALWHAIQLAQASPRKASLIVMISDGSPTECTVEALTALVNKATHRMGICCAQIALRSLDFICFPHYVEVTDEHIDLAIHRFGSIIADLVRKTIAR